MRMRTSGHSERDCTWWSSDEEHVRMKRKLGMRMVEWPEQMTSAKSCGK